ncbi:hypothetical protein AB0N21_15465, partial [Streptomyces sp. NPDC051080]|uniref:hypothetical protein n=1 Tax=Streptomyces sp. NPDC051080 TaxID=3157222 RepID=UPI00343EB356
MVRSVPRRPALPRVALRRVAPRCPASPRAAPRRPASRRPALPRVALRHPAPYDHTADEVRTYPLHRITGVAELADDAT